MRLVKGWKDGWGCFSYQEKDVRKEDHFLAGEGQCVFRVEHERVHCIKFSCVCVIVIFNVDFLLEFSVDKIEENAN